MPAADLHQSQQALSTALERARMGEDRDLAAQVRDAGERFVRQLFGALRLTRLHDLDNAAFDKPVAELCGSLHELHTLLGAVHLVTVEGQVYINDVRVRLDERLDTAAQLGRELGRHAVGGLSLHEALSTHELKQLVDAFGSEPDPDTPRRRLRERLAAAGIQTVDLVGSYRFRVSGDDDTIERVDPEVTRARAASLVDATVDALSARRMPNPLPIRRTITEMLKAGVSAEGLLDQPAGRSAFAAHTLRISMLAMVVGDQLGLGQEVLQDLGVTAMFHDIGYADREGAEHATPESPAVAGYAPPFERHGRAGARLLLRQRGFHESKILRALGTLHQTWRHDDPRGRPSLFGRILAVCEAYDALTVLGPDLRRPAGALAAIQCEAGTRYDPRVVQALVNGLGRWPPGSVLELEDGRVVRVVGLPSGPADWQRPRCRLVRDAAGQAPATVQAVDLRQDTTAVLRERDA